MTSRSVIPETATQRTVVVSAGLLIMVLMGLSGEAGGYVKALAVLIGVLAGFSLYHASFGFTAAWRRVFAERRGVGLRYQFLLIVLTSLVAYPLIYYTQARGFVLPVGVGMLVGSFLFGFGMQFGGGCGSGTLFVAGGGSTRMLITLAFFILGSLIGTAHVGWWHAIPFPEIMQVGLGIGNRVSFGMINAFGPWLALVLLCGVLGTIALITIVFERQKYGSLEPPRKTVSILRGPWSPREGAIGLALVGVLCILVIGQPWGVTFAFAVWGAKVATLFGVDVASWPYWDGWRGNVLSNSVFSHSVSVMNFGIMAGALAAAGFAAKFKPVWLLSRVEIGTAVFGGLLMGYGARLAYGCNIGAYLGGLVSGSLHGWAWAVMAFIGSCLAILVKRRFGL